MDWYCFDFVLSSSSCGRHAHREKSLNEDNDIMVNTLVFCFCFCFFMAENKINFFVVFSK